MSQGKIIKILEKKGRLSATEIINELSEDNEPKEFIRRSLKQMRKYGDLKFICVGLHEVNTNSKVFDVEFWNGIKKKIKDDLLYKKFPELKDRKITRSCYLYFLGEDK